MIDLLIGVPGEFAVVEAELLVEVYAGAECEDAGAEAGEESGGGSAAVAFEQELVFECVDDRFDPLPDPAGWRVGSVGLVGAAWPEEKCAQFGYGGFEVGAGEAFVADDLRAFDRVGFEQRERCLSLTGVSGDEVEVDDRAVGGAEQNKVEAPVAARDRMECPAPRS